MQARPRAGFLSSWSPVVALWLSNILSQDTAVVSFLCLDRGPLVLIPMWCLYHLAFRCMTGFLLSLLHVTALLIGFQWFPSALQFSLERPPQTLAFLFFSLLTIRLIVLSLACALKSLTIFFKVNLLKMWIPRFHSRPIKSVSLAWGLRNKYFLEVPLMVPVPGEGWESLP